MTRLAFQQYELNLTVFVQIPALVCRPVFGNQIALDNTGFFGVSTDVVSLVIAVQSFTRRFFVEEDHWHVLTARFLNNSTRSRRVNQVDSQRFHAFCQQHVDLIVLFGLVVLRVVHQQLNIWRRFRVCFDSLTHHGHKVIVIFIDCHTDASISSVRSRAE